MCSRTCCEWVCAHLIGWRKHVNRCATPACSHAFTLAAAQTHRDELPPGGPRPAAICACSVLCMSAALTCSVRQGDERPSYGGDRDRDRGRRGAPQPSALRTDRSFSLGVNHRRRPWWIQRPRGLWRPSKLRRRSRRIRRGAPQLRRRRRPLWRRPPQSWWWVRTPRRRPRLWSEYLLDCSLLFSRFPIYSSFVLFASMLTIHAIQYRRRASWWRPSP